MKKTIITIALAFFVLAVDAQNISENNLFKIGVQYEFNSNRIENQEMNLFLQENNYSGFSNIISESAFGISLRSIQKPSLVHFTFYYGNSVTDQEQKSILNSLGFSIRYLHDLASSEKWTFAPFINAKITNYKLIAVSKTDYSNLSNALLEEIVQNNNNPQIGFGLLIDRRIGIQYLDLFLGLKADYTQNLTNKEWKNSRFENLDKLPKQKLSGFNIGVSLRMELNILKIKNIDL